MRNFVGTRSMCRLAILAGLLLGILGCGKDHDATEKRLHQLQDELTRLQNSNDRLEERVTSLELTRAPPSGATAQPVPDAAEQTVERPPLKVVRLGPEQPKAPSSEESARAAKGEASEPASEPAPPGDDSPRTLIRGQGSRLETRVSRGKSTGSGFKRAEVAPPIQNDRTRQTDSRSAHAKPD